MQDEYDLTVVVASVEASRSIERCLLALDEACAGITTQIILADASRDDTAALVRRRWPSVRVLRLQPGVLTPRLWSAGLQLARGRVVGFTLGHLFVARTWARALVQGLPAVAGLGGPMVLSDDAGVADWAVFYQRYSAFLTSQLPDGPVAGEIAGDNAAYTRRALTRHLLSFAQGFWEVDFHRLLRADGGVLGATRQATASFGLSAPFGCTVRHRYLHGRHFGASRVAHGSSALRIVAAAPLVPLILAWRAARRALPAPEHRRRFLLALPLFLVLASAWAAGEARGALAGGAAADDPRS